MPPAPSPRKKANDGRFSHWRRRHSGGVCTEVKAQDVDREPQKDACWGGIALIEDAVRFEDLRAHHRTATENGALDADPRTAGSTRSARARPRASMPPASSRSITARSRAFAYSIRVESLITEPFGSKSMAGGGALGTSVQVIHVAGVAKGPVSPQAASDETVLRTGILRVKDALRFVDYDVGGDAGISAFALDVNSLGMWPAIPELCASTSPSSFAASAVSR